MKKVVLISCLLGFTIFIPAQEINSESPKDTIQCAAGFSSNPRIKVEIPVWEDELKSYVSSRVKYPEKAIEKGREGRVLIRIAVEADGSLSGFKILIDEIGYGAARNVVKTLKKLPDFKPAWKNGKPVRSFYTFSLDFVLPK